MNRHRLIPAILLGILLVPGLVSAKTPRVDKRISNLFMQNFRNEGFSYIVDPIAQLCFMQTHNGGVIEIDCAALKRRGEWYDVIYWITWEEKK